MSDLILDPFESELSPNRLFVCPYNPGRTFRSFSAFLGCNGCVESTSDEYEFDCRLVELYAHTAYLNNLHCTGL